MTQEEIIRMAREAGIEADECNGYLEWWNFAKLVAAHEREKQAEQEPMFFVLTQDHTWLSISEEKYEKVAPEGRMKVYAAPVRTKDLTDDEVAKACGWEFGQPLYEWVIGLARAVIAADREKNK